MRHDDFCELGVVKTATPCSESWDEMTGDDVKRFCAKCRLHVYDFAALTTNEARALVLKTEGRLCARIFTREDGTVLTKDCPTGVTRQRRKRVGAVAVAAALLGGATTAVVAALPEEECELVDETRNPPQAQDAALLPQPIVSGNAPGSVRLGGMMRPSSVKPAKKMTMKQLLEAYEKKKR